MSINAKVAGLCVSKCVCVCVCMTTNLVLIPCNYTRISCIVKSHDTWVIDRYDAAGQHKPWSSVQWSRNSHSSANAKLNIKEVHNSNILICKLTFLLCGIH